MDHAHKMPTTAARSPVKAQHTAVQYPKWFGGSASCMAVCLTHPLDLLKVRLQTTPLELRKGLVGTVTHILRSDGITGLYNGLSAALMRQILYGATRFAVYENVKDMAAKGREGKAIPFTILFPSALLGGGIGGMVGTPADMANVRMQNDKSLPRQQRQNYRHVFDVWARVVREEGSGGLFRGIVPNSIRAGFMTGCQLACYDGFKDLLIGSGLGLKDNTVTQLTASILSGLVSTTFGSPIDVVKTRIMSSKSTGASASILGTMATLTKTEGIRWAFRGWLPSFGRMGPHTAATLMILEQHRRVYRKITGSDEHAV